MSYLGYKVKTQTLVERDGRIFDVFTAVNEAGSERTFHFDVTHFRRARAGKSHAADTGDMK